MAKRFMQDIDNLLIDNLKMKEQIRILRKEQIELSGAILKVMAAAI